MGGRVEVVGQILQNTVLLLRILEIRCGRNELVGSDTLGIHNSLTCGVSGPTHRDTKIVDDEKPRSRCRG